MTHITRSLVALAAGTVAALALASPASADHGLGGSSLSQSADVSVCGQVTLTGTNEEHLVSGSPMAFGIVWTTEDGQAGVFGVPGEHVVTFAEDVNGGSVWVSFGISVGAESDWYLAHDTATVDTDCEPVPSPAPTTPPAPPAPTPAEPESCELVDQLDVAAEKRAGYDRDLFGNYDRDALLAASFAEHGDYYSVWDDTHYADAGEVDVDHTVALAEAWDSGAHSWDAATLDAFAGDVINLTLLTDGVNQGAKSDNDFAEWVPPVGSLLDEYLVVYVGVKATYGLSVDEAERVALLAAAEELGLCDATTGGGGGTGDDGDGKDLPVTGSAPLKLAAVAGGLGAAGLAAVVLPVLWARRRRNALLGQPIE